MCMGNEKRRSCHPERSEGSALLDTDTEILRCAQDDKTFPILVVNVYQEPVFFQNMLQLARSPIKGGALMGTIIVCSDCVVAQV